MSSIDSRLASIIEGVHDAHALIFKDTTSKKIRGETDLFNRKIQAERKEINNFFLHLDLIFSTIDRLKREQESISNNDQSDKIRQLQRRNEVQKFILKR